MTYDPNIPAGTQNLSESQQDMQANFSAANSIYGTDHSAFTNTTVGQTGFHKKVTLVDQTGSEPLPPVGTAVMYNLQDTDISQSVPVWRRDNTTYTYPVAPIRAWAFATRTGTALNIQHSYNIDSITFSGSTGNYTVQITAPGAPNTNYAVFAQAGFNNTSNGAAVNVDKNGVTATQFRVRIKEVASSISGGSQSSNPDTFAVQVIW